ncbi:MAG TPA: SPOR domain-containing protein [Anaeromyxobacteraceae bacterium]|nr:SPOR domain-containing protein [Anaeromyxobacteraceae bacterium]
MRDENVPSRERVDLSLDGRQIAAAVVAALVVLGVVFVLGLNVGRAVARREAEAAHVPGDLSALDRPPVQAPARSEPFTYHDTLTGERPAAPPPAPPVPAPSAAVTAAVTAGQPATAPQPGNAAPAGASANAAAPAPAAAAATAAPLEQAAPARRHATFSVQVGSTRDRAEAERIAARFRARAPRVEAADLGAKGTWWRVRVGAFASRDEARRCLADLSRETGVKGLVASEP